MPLAFPAYILAGGQSSRFGSDKARALLQGQPLIVRQAATLRGLGLAVTVIADVPGKYADLGLPTLADRIAGRGPLGGLLTALEHALPSILPFAPSGWTLVSSCDLLDLRPPWLEMLAQAIRPGAAIIAFRGDRWQPFPGLYHTSLGPEIQRRLEAGELAVWRLLESAATLAVPLPPDWPAAAQANTPEDLARFDRSKPPV